MPELTYSENFVNSMQLKLLDFQVAKDDKESFRGFLTSTKIKSLFNLTAQNFEQNIQQYEEAIAEAKKIIAEIDEEVK